LEDANGGFFPRVLGIIAGILVARHLKTTDELFDNRSSPRNRNASWHDEMSNIAQTQDFERCMMLATIPRTQEEDRS
jgi:hypothetical protein